MKSPPTPSGLSEAERTALEGGQHEHVAERLRARQRPDLAGWVLEQIWAFQEAFGCYVEADDLIGALRVAVEAARPDTVERALSLIEQSAETGVVEAAVEFLRERGRSLEAARLLGRGDGDPKTRAAFLERAGDRFGAAQALSAGGFTREALDSLSPLFETERGHADARALAARLAWDLGDAEGAARHAQHALRGGWDSPELRALLGRALGSLGHDLAAQIVLRQATASAPALGELPARYRVTGSLSAPFAGAAYVGIDRVTLEEVEIHLLLAEHPTSLAEDPELQEKLQLFALEARLGARIGHPAIRPIRLIDSATGLVVFPRAEGPALRALIRPPGLHRSPGRVRALVAFILEGLLAASAHGLSHGSLLPSQMVGDALGRPLLGPFGTHHLAGLAATRTGTLEELIRLSAPELRSGGPPTTAGDVYALGALMQALLRGSLDPREGSLPPGPEADLALRMTAEDPNQRPDPGEVLQELQAPVADTRELGLSRSEESSQAWQAIEPGEPDPTQGIMITPAPSWTDEQLDALCEHANPWMQPILDRDERLIVLAPWPSGSKVLDTPTIAAGQLLPQEAWSQLPDPVRDAVQARLRPTSLVATPSGEWMLALDDLLTR